MEPDTQHLKSPVAHRLRWQSNYEPKLRGLVETRSVQLRFNDQERNFALRSIDALVWKLTAAGIHLERLWEHRESSALKQLLLRSLDRDPEPRRFTDEEEAFLTAEFDAYLFQARAFIGVVQVHTLDACRISFGGRLTNAEYRRLVRTARPDVQDRLKNAGHHFEHDVFGPGKWGAILTSLRDRVAHCDRVRPAITSSIEVGEAMTVRGQSLEALAQDFENGSYDLLVNVIAPIWEREWRAGPYHPGMWT